MLGILNSQGNNINAGMLTSGGNNTNTWDPDHTRKYKM
jgi:hypothetical protein